MTTAEPASARSGADGGDGVSARRSRSPRAPQILDRSARSGDFAGALAMACLLAFPVPSVTVLSVPGDRVEIGGPSRARVDYFTWPTSRIASWGNARTTPRCFTGFSDVYSHGCSVASLT